MYIFWDIWRLISSPMLNAPRTRGELLVAEFPGLLVDVALVQVGGKGTWGRSRRTGQEVAQGGDQEVIRHQILVHDPISMAILRSQHSLDKIEPECE